MMQAFACPLEDLALDYSRVRAQSTRRVETSCEGVHGKDPDKFSFSCFYWGGKSPLATEYRAIRKAATKEIRSGSCPQCAAVSAMRTLMA